MTTNDNVLDPDPFTIIASVSAAVSAVCAVVTVARGKTAATPILAAKQPFWSEQFTKEIDELSGDVRGLIRWLASGPGVDFDPLSRQYEFGATALFLTPADQIRYYQLSQSITNHLGNLMDLGIKLQQFDPDFVGNLGHQVLQQIHSVEKRVNGLFRGGHTNGEVLDSCLDLLQTVERIAGQLIRPRDGNL